MFRRLLIANRGEVAARVARTCRRLGVEVVAVASTADRDQAWLEDVDHVVDLGPAPSRDSYLDAAALIEVALATGATAVHPGWGFLSENSLFAARCSAAGLTFVGPPSRHMREFGDKAQARATMGALGMPLIPGSDGPLPDLATARKVAEQVGYPVLLKAVSGGGGRGMRFVDEPAQLEAAWRDASMEAASAFGDARLYLEKRILGGRHVEIQVIADAWGSAWSLGERECSMQRRHQKVLEEGPSPGLSASERERILPLVADVIARSGYTNAGTVEMLLSSEGQLYFMEMNTRLQVEHPVTELLTGLDLVELQLQVAANHRLDLAPRTTGHAIECRINAEDPSKGFRPSPGTLTKLRWPSGEGIRVDTHVSEGDRVPPNYDSMLGKIIVHAQDRPAAIARMEQALANTVVEGVSANLALHAEILAWPEFREGNYDTTTLEDRLGEELMARILLDPLGAELQDTLGPDERERNTAWMAELESALRDKRAVVHDGWGDKYRERVHAKGKWTTWERIEALKDEGSQVFEVGTLVNWDRDFQGSKRQAPGAGVVTCFTRVQERWCIVIANDNTVASGAWWPNTPEKIERAQEMALRLRLPVIYLVDCSGLFLPEQARSFPGATGAGHIFKKNALLANSGVPQLAGVFGDCIAGGGYMPIISDRVYMTESAYMVIAGAALIKGAKSQALTSLDIGGPEVHVHQSRCADVRVPDDPTAIAALRQEIARLPSTAVEFYRHGAEPASPRYATRELSSMFPPDPRQHYDIDQVLARLVDDGLFHEVMGHTGREVVTGVARISGLWVGIIANRLGRFDHPNKPGESRVGGILYREGIAKVAAFSRACNDDGVPIVWLQDISGFDIGVEAERLGLLGYGSSLIYTNSTNQVPMFTVLLRRASGAGYYAMSGLPYDPVVQLSTPITRQAVMEGRTLAIAAFNTKLDDDFEIATDDPDERAAIEEGMRKTAARIEADMDPVRSAAQMDTDEVVSMDELRGWLTCLVESAWQSAGYRRTKNPRIWSIHDLEVLCEPR